MPNNTSCVAHYTKIGNIENILRDSGVVLWATRYGFFSDKEEYIGPFEKIFPYLKPIADDNGYEFDSEQSVFPYIISFSNDIDSEYMWTHYAQDGIMLVFDRVKLYQYCNDFIIKTRQFRICENVVYQNGTFKDAVINALHNLQGSFAQENLLDAFYYIPAFIKRNEYVDENEFRLIHCCHEGFTISYENQIPIPFEEKPENLKTRRSKDGVEIPYMEIQLPKEALVAVCLPINSSEADREKIYRLLRERQYTAGIFQSKYQS